MPRITKELCDVPYQSTNKMKHRGVINTAAVYSRGQRPGGPIFWSSSIRYVTA
jgi:hypothetical protein